MSTPAPAGQGRSVADVVTTIRDAPRWVLISVVVVGGLLAWYLLRGRDTTEADYGDWRSRAVALLVERGYNREASERAVGRYLDGGYLGPEDVSLIAIVIRSLGTPDMRTEAPSETSPNYLDNSNPGTEYADSFSAYWYVPAAPAGWSSTFNGISQQFYGDTARAVLLQQSNPNLSETTYGKLPVGAMVKVPRS